MGQAGLHSETLRESCDMRNRTELEHDGEDAKAALTLPHQAGRRRANGASGLHSPALAAFARRSPGAPAPAS